MLCEPSLKLHNPALKILALTIHDAEPYPSRLLHAGAAGYLTKGCDPEEMIRAIQTVHSGQHYVSPEIAQKIAIKRYVKGEESPLEMLSERELQIMQMVVQGQTVNEISKKLCLSSKTVNSYRYRVFEKLNIKGDVELTLMAMRMGMIVDNNTPAEPITNE